MQSLTGTVGEGGKNNRHDAALVQALLTLAQRPASLDATRPTYLSAIDGACGDRTVRAIQQFQFDQVFGDAVGNVSRPAPGVLSRVIAPEDSTWRKLTAAVPTAFGDLRVLTGSKTVYVAGTAADLSASIATVARLTFQPDFRAKVSAVINRMYESHGIVPRVCRDGDRRTFQTQYELLVSGRGVTSAGPGESNHNFGQAVDLGFEGLRWLKSDGTLVQHETPWLHELDPRQFASGEALFFWNALRSIGTAIGLHRGPMKDRPHLQAWSDAGVDMADRLAALLTRTGGMRWSGRDQRYQCDLGFGGRYFDVGLAAQIWNRQATINEIVLTQARGQSNGHAAGVEGEGPSGVTPYGGPRLNLPPVTAQDVTAMRESLRADFMAADRNWERWDPR
jgi:hypothetical protein